MARSCRGRTAKALRSSSSLDGNLPCASSQSERLWSACPRIFWFAPAMSNLGPAFGNTSPHPRPRKKDETDAMTQKLFLQIARAANPNPIPESSKQTKLTIKYGHRKYGPSEVCTRTQFQRREKPRTKAGRLKNIPHPAITIAVHLSV